MADADTTTSGGTTVASDWYFKQAQSLLEAELKAAQSGVDSWAALLEGHTTDESGMATPVRGIDWLTDIWIETIQNATVNLDTAMTDHGIDIDRMQTLWLHAIDDAVTDIGKTPEFATTIGAGVDQALQAQAAANERRRAAFEAVGLPTTAEIDELGRGLVDLEYRQKRVEDRLDRLEAVIAGRQQAGGKEGEP